MDQFRADLHIHSRHSRATSKSLSPRLLAAWSRVKGLDVLATGDFTHPGWLAELKEALAEEGTGLLRLREPAGLDREIPFLAGIEKPGQARFMLSAEISSIYKRGGKTRKIHNLVYLPSFASAEKLNAKLAKIGNLESDGRPILGLDSRHLLELVLETDPLAFLVPAHIWTPWFSLFGSKSGFDSIEECFGALAKEVFALETGLSSDPEMNRLWSALDRFRLISNSDAHSGEKLGRECNVFSGGLSFETIYRALRGEGLAAKFLGTVEFFPEEGKYHMDGHRACNVVMDPQETRQRGGICPVCGKPLTVGVLNRVLELADRSVPAYPPGWPQGEPGFVSLIPLPEILGEIVGARPGTKKVNEFYARLLRRFPSELAILMDVSPEELGRVSQPLGEAVSRMRRGQVVRRPGFDGEYGAITVFSDAERREILGGRTLVAMPGDKAAGAKTEPAPIDEFTFSVEPAPAPRPLYNFFQRKALEAGPGPVLTLAGPGTGKTHTLVGRVIRLLDEGVDPAAVLVVTFTRRAAEELRERLRTLRGESAPVPRADTLHALAFEHWTAQNAGPPLLLSEEAARRTFAAACPGLTGTALRAAWNGVNLARERLVEDGGEHAKAAILYAKQKQAWNLADYSDLLEFWLDGLQGRDYGRGRQSWKHVLVDEIQDFSRLQLELAVRLAPKNGEGFFAIGDPNQSIYSFRGALPGVKAALLERWPNLEVIGLSENFRSRQAVLDLSDALLEKPVRLRAAQDGEAEISLFHAPSAAREASWIGEKLRGLLGPTSHSLMDARPKAAARVESPSLSPGDCAVLVRARALIPIVEKTLTRLGVPCSAPEEEAFWREPRVALILRAAGRMLGVPETPALSGQGDAGEEAVPCPDRALAKGPLGVSAYLQDIAPFDRLFWQSQAFKRLQKAYDERGGWAGLINWVHLQSELDLVKRKAETVQIMTLHAAKGLEFEAVFLPALEDGLLPFAGHEFLTGKAVLPAPEGRDAREGKDGREGRDGRSGREGESWPGFEVEEELRLFYVGVTRAKRFLYLSHAASRDLYGRTLRLAPSRFLKLLPESLLKKTALKARVVKQEKQLTLL